MIPQFANRTPHHQRLIRHKGEIIRTAPQGVEQKELLLFFQEGMGDVWLIPVTLDKYCQRPSGCQATCGGMVDLQAFAPAVYASSEQVADTF
jgi:hypothetical protein